MLSAEIITTVLYDRRWRLLLDDMKEEDRATQNSSFENSESSARIIAVDFDGVIANYEGWGNGTPGPPRLDTVKALRILREEGWRIIVHSCRDESILANYLSHHEIPFDEINPGSKYAGLRGKPAANVYWDDRAHRYSGDALEDLKAIRNFRTWNGRS